MYNHHDSEIYGIIYNEEHASLVLYCRSSLNVRYEMSFENVKYIDFDTFSTRNTILDFRQIKREDLTPKTIEQYQIGEEELSIMSEDICLFLFLSDGGMDGYVIASFSSPIISDTNSK